MGLGTFNNVAYRAYASTTTTNFDGSFKSVNQVFTQNTVHKLLDPSNITLRESCDSTDNPNSTPVIIALDVTGSMGMIAHNMVATQLGDMIEGILDNNIISNPHIMFMAVGDVDCDSVPLQVSQFEADNRIVQQLTDIFVEGGGGGNATESYDLPWYFAATRTKIDSFIKRGKKGYLFTVGDELVPNGLTPNNIKQVFGTNDQVDKRLTARELYEMASEQYDVFHFIIEEGNYARRNLQKVYDDWYNLIGKRAILISDYKQLANVIQAVMRVNEGEDPDSVIQFFQDTHTRHVVEHAIYGNVSQ